MSDKARRRSRLGLTRILPDRTQPATRKKARDWWPESEAVAAQLELAEAKGHRFSGVERLRDGTCIWSCDTCGRTVKNVFEQDAAWAEGVGWSTIKAEAAAWPCRG